MSEEQKTSSSFMQELDKWTDANVVMPLFNTSDESGWKEAVARVKKAIREKVLQSYRNGQMSRRGFPPENLPTQRRYPVPMRH